MKKILVLFFLVKILYSYGQYNYDVKFYNIDIKVDPTVHYIKGNVKTIFTTQKNNFDKVRFDFSEALQIDSIIYNSKKINYIRDKDTLFAILPKSLTKNILDSIKIYYEGSPSDKGFGSFITGTHNGTAIMWTLSEPYGSEIWWPCKQTLYDKADSVDMIVRTPLKYNVASNGIIKSIDTVGNTKITHWHTSYPIATYLIAFAASNYVSYYDYADIGDSIKIPILEMVYPENLANAKEQSADIVGSLKFYCDSFMLYPFWKEKYGQAQFGWGGGMENQTMTFVSNFNHNLTSHELAHQWFGDYITCGSWHDIWLNEGFAVFLEGLTAEAGLADYSYIDWKKKCINNGTSINYGSVYVDDTTSVDRIFSYQLTYMKGGMLLEMLRWILGDKAFFKGIRSYLHDPKLAYKFAHLKDLKEHLESASDTNLTEFFNQWYYGNGFPFYSVLWSQKNKNQIKITISQISSTQGTNFFAMKIPIELIGNKLDTLVILNNTKNNQNFTIKTNFYVKDIVFDPNKNIFTRNPQIFHIIDPDEKKIKIVPNPVNNSKINISLNYPRKIKDVKIFDIKGKIIYKKNYNSYKQNITIKKLHLSTGTYIVEINTTDEILNTYFVKL
jgi:aminopeptidase N